MTTDIKDHQDRLRQIEEQIKQRDKLKVDRLIWQDEADMDRHIQIVEWLDNIMDTPEDAQRFRLTHFLSGRLSDGENELFYHTVFAKKKGKFTPVVVFSNSKLEVVKNNAYLLLENEKDEDGKPLYKKLKDIPQDEHYQFFEYKNTRYKYPHKVFFDETHGINTVDNSAIQDVIKNRIYNKDIYDELTKTIRTYYFHSSNYEYDVLCSASIVSYLIHLLGNVFYLVFLGGMGAGKSTGLTLLSFLQLNGRFGGKGSVPSSVRLIHQFSIALNQDEFEKISGDEKNILVNVFNTGFNRYGKYTITNMGVKDVSKQVVGFNTYGMKSFTCNSLGGFDPSFIDRCHVIIQVKTTRKLSNIFNLSNRELNQFQELRNQQFVYCLHNWGKILDDINQMRQQLESEGVFGRETDKNCIILGIIRHFKGHDYALVVKKYLEEKAPVLQLEHMQTMEHVVLETIANECSIENVHFIEVLNDTLYEAILERFELNPNDKYAPKNQKPRKILDNLGLVQKKENLGYSKGGKRKYIINTQEFIKVLENHGYSKILEKVYGILGLKPPKPLKPLNEEIEGIEEVEELESKRFLLNDKISDVIKIINQHPDDNYHFVEQKYGQKFIDGCLEHGILNEPVLGKTLEYIGGK